MENNVIIIIAAAVIIGIITVFRFYKQEAGIDIENKICFYYRFAGDIEWLKSQIERYRFDSLKYLLPCKNKEESDFRITISDIEGEMEINFYATEFNYSKKMYLSPIVQNLKVSDEQYENMLDHLKDTYMEDGKNDNFLSDKVEA